MTAINCAICGKPLSPDDGDGTLCRRCEQDESTPVSLGTSGSNPNLPLVLLLACSTAAVFYAIGPLLLFRDTFIFHLFCGHGWVPHVCVFLFCFALWSMLLKVPLINRQRAAFELKLLPETAEGYIKLDDAQRILARIGRLTRKQKSLLLVSRIRQALLRLNQLGTAEKLDDLLRYRAESDLNAMESSYAGPKFIIWAIPVLGFVGTVLGISNGVQAFSSLIQNASDLDGLRESLKGVTYGLGQAFETTMIALCMSLCLMLVLSWLQRKEDRVLAAIDEYCIEHLLQKVNVPSPDRLSAADLAAFTQALRDFTQYCREIQNSKPHTPSTVVRPVGD